MVIAAGLLVCRIPAAQFLVNSPILFRDLNSDLEIHHHRQSIDNDRTVVWQHDRRPSEMIAEESLVEPFFEAGTVGHAPNKIEPYEPSWSLALARRIVLGQRVDICSRCAGRQMPFDGMILRRKRIEPFGWLGFGMIAQVALHLGSVERSWNTGSGRRIPNVNLDILRNRFPEILYRKFQPLSRILPAIVIHEKYIAVGRHFYREPWTLRNHGLPPYFSSLFLRLSDLVLHGTQLPVINQGDDCGEDQAPDGDIKGIGLADYLHFRSCPWLLIIRLTECLCWLGLMYLGGGVSSRAAAVGGLFGFC